MNLSLQPDVNPSPQNDMEYSPVSRDAMKLAESNLPQYIFPRLKSNFLPKLPFSSFTKTMLGFCRVHKVHLNPLRLLLKQIVLRP